MSLCGPQTSAIISPSGFRVRIMERKTTSPQIAIKNHRVKFWTTHIMMSTGQDFIPKPYSPSASQIKDVFLSMDFVISTGKLLQKQGGPDPKSHLHTQEQNQFLLCATNATSACVAEESLQHLHLCLDAPKLQPSQVTFVAM